MGNRYYITGVQLGMLLALVDENYIKVKDILIEIEHNQFIGDAETLKKMMEENGNNNKTN